MGCKQSKTADSVTLIPKKTRKVTRSKTPKPNRRKSVSFKSPPKRTKTLLLQKENSVLSQQIMPAQRKSMVAVQCGLKDLLQNWKLDKKELGKGAFGTVFNASNVSDPDVRVAVKILDKGQMTLKQVQEAMSEIGILQTLDNPFIVDYLETYQDSRYLYLIMENCPGGELIPTKEDNTKEAVNFTEEKTRGIMQHLLMALAHAHKHLIMHRDIKPENIMWGDDGNVRLVDFGLAMQTKNKMNKFAGTIFYMAPEVLDEKAYDCGCDVWSLGCVLYMMVTGKLPFSGKSQGEVFPKIREAVYEEPTTCSANCADLIKKMLTKDPAQRWSAKQCLEHQWFQQTWFSPAAPPVQVSEEIFQSLRSFKTSSKLHKAAVQMLVKLISRSELSNLSKTFQSIDIDNSGVINQEELAEALKKSEFNLSDEELKDMVTKIELNSGSPERMDSRIEYTEFLAATINLEKYLTKQKLKALFDQFDLDSTGIISMQNLKDAFTKLGSTLDDEQAKEIMSIHDSNQDDGIDFSEFRAMLMPHAELDELLVNEDDDQKFNQRMQKLELMKQKSIKSPIKNFDYEASSVSSDDSEEVQKYKEDESAVLSGTERGQI